MPAFSEGGQGGQQTGQRQNDQGQQQARLEAAQAQRACIEALRQGPQRPLAPAGFEAGLQQAGLPILQQPRHGPAPGRVNAGLHAPDDGRQGLGHGGSGTGPERVHGAQGIDPGRVHLRPLAEELGAGLIVDRSAGEAVEPVHRGIIARATMGSASGLADSSGFRNIPRLR